MSEDQALARRIYPIGQTYFDTTRSTKDIVVVDGLTNGGPKNFVGSGPKWVNDLSTNVGMLLPGECPVPNCKEFGPNPPPCTPLLTELEANKWWLHAGTAGQVHDLCRRTPDNRVFYHRPASWASRLGRASTGFLLEGEVDGRRLFATTLHSLSGLAHDSTNYVVFGFLDHPDNGWGLFVENVAKVKRVYARGDSTRHVADDWALLEVVQLPGGKLGSGLAPPTKALDDTLPLAVISHSLGLPKSFGPGDVQEDRGSEFVHTCDTLGGSSGAPLLVARGARQGEVVGMCVRGGHLRSTPSGGTAPIPVGDPREPFFGANLALTLPFTADQPAGASFPYNPTTPPWPTSIPIQVARHGHRVVKDTDESVSVVADGTNWLQQPKSADSHHTNVTINNHDHTLTVSKDKAIQLHWGGSVVVDEGEYTITILPWD